MTTEEMIASVAAAKRYISRLPSAGKNAALNSVADSIEKYAAEILRANAEDMRAAQNSVSQVMLDRLELTPERIKAMAEGVRCVAGLPDPVGRVLSGQTRRDGLTITKVAVPLGVVAIIYESRPNVTSDAAALCIKSGNACILRTGKEAHRSAAAIVKAMRAGLEAAGLNGNIIGFAEDISRDSATRLMRAKGYVDLLIPRGGAGLIKACVENATVPCIETGTGICHVYVDGKADFSKALKIVENAKCSRPSVCNAAEVCLVDVSVAEKFLPLLYEKLAGKVQFFADGTAFGILRGKSGVFPAVESDFDTEFLDYKLAVAAVEGVEGAVAHIFMHSTGHSDCIVTEDKAAAEKFTSLVDSAAVYVNASTRFTDGGEFGLGCEMGISTQKLHARGPMGLEELTTYKYIISGNGNVR